jgi:hypothetical protein
VDSLSMLMRCRPISARISAPRLRGDSVGMQCRLSDFRQIVNDSGHTLRIVDSRELAGCLL